MFSMIGAIGFFPKLVALLFFIFQVLIFARRRWVSFRIGIFSYFDAEGKNEFKAESQAASHSQFRANFGRKKDRLCEKDGRLLEDSPATGQ